jgi:chaperonin cofactor prefoldin
MSKKREIKVSEKLEELPVAVARIEEKQDHLQRGFEELKELLNTKYATKAELEAAQKEIDTLQADIVARRKQARMMVWSVVFLFITQFSQIFLNRDMILRLLGAPQVEAKK